MKKLVWLWLFWLFIPEVCARQERALAVMFWNLENFFDVRHDSLKQDTDFLPDALRGWNRSRYEKKVEQVARVIVAAHGWEPPVLIGVCEVENSYVMNSLVDYGPLRELGYRYVMTDSPDIRGIDVGLIYRRDRFRLISSQAVRVHLDNKPTRDILHVTGRLVNRDTLDVVVAHFPSRLGGVRFSEHYRLSVARRIRSLTDSICTVRRVPRIVLMGDFNDHPNNRSVCEVLHALSPSGKVEGTELYHLLADKTGDKNATYKYQGQWELLDHLIVSGNLLNPDGSVYTSSDRAKVLRLPFLLVKDEKFGGDKPYRTYNGVRYQGGFSDHLPVLVELIERDGPEE